MTDIRNCAISMLELGIKIEELKQAYLRMWMNWRRASRPWGVEDIPWEKFRWMDTPTREMIKEVERLVAEAEKACGFKLPAGPIRDLLGICKYSLHSGRWEYDEDVGGALLDLIYALKRGHAPQSIPQVHRSGTEYSANQLRDMAKQRGVSPSGTKSELMKRLGL